MMGGAKAHYDGIEAFSETDQTEDLTAITVPTLVMHGEDDQVVPYRDAALLEARLLKDCTLKTYPGYPHGMPTTQAEIINADLLASSDDKCKGRSAPGRRLRCHRLARPPWRAIRRSCSPESAFGSGATRCRLK
jgi:dienelactone hydrolase